MADDFSALDATAQAELVRKGEVTPSELLEAAIDRIEAKNPALTAVVTKLYDHARGAAAGALPDGPFRGVPFLIKDLGIQLAGVPHYGGTRFLRDAGYSVPHDSYLMQKYRAAGFVTCGKTATPELGILPTTEPEAFGPTRNPWNLERATGGSSGGSAAAVAAGLVAVAHGNDGGGSIRIPAGACGLVGLKPTRGRNSAGPDIGAGMGGLTCDHVLARSVRDTAAILDCTAGPMPGDPYYAPPPARPFLAEVGADPGKLRVGFSWSYQATDGTRTEADADCVAAVEAARRLLEKLGHKVTRSSPAALAEPEYTPRFLAIWSCGFAEELGHWRRTLKRAINQDHVEPLTWALAGMGQDVTGPAYVAAWHWLHQNSRRLASWWADDGFDLYLTPTVSEPPLPFGEFETPRDAGIMAIFRAAKYAPFTPPFNVSGQPAISLPLHQSGAGLPIGIQLVAPYAREDLLLRVAAQLEREVDGWKFPAA
jgi:amidase